MPFRLKNAYRGSAPEQPALSPISWRGALTWIKRNVVIRMECLGPVNDLLTNPLRTFRKLTGKLSPEW